MRLHANAGLGPRGRAVMVGRVLEGWSVRQAAAAAGVSAQTCRKWLARDRAEGAAPAAGAIRLRGAAWRRAGAGSGSLPSFHTTIRIRRCESGLVPGDRKRAPTGGARRAGGHLNGRALTRPGLAW